MLLTLEVSSVRRVVEPPSSRVRPYLIRIDHITR
jgi:hypothetical protein